MPELKYTLSKEARLQCSKWSGIEMGGGGKKRKSESERKATLQRRERE